MTAEVSVMNKGAVAMAADSAITVVGRKVYNSGSKLFPLSQRHAVGVMIYGNAALMGVPWEVIVAEYRLQIQNRNFDKVSSIGEDFIKFLAQSDRLIPKELQSSYILDVYRWFLSTVRDDINREIQNRIGQGLASSAVAQIVEQILDGALSQWENASYVPDATAQIATELVELHRVQIESAIAETFQKLPISESCRTRLSLLIGHLAFKRWLFHIRKSGIVLCGFGDSEVYPAQFSVELESVISGIVKYDQPNNVVISDQMSSTIHPFAQQDVALSFLQGIDPNFKLVIDDYLKGIFSGLGGALSGVELEKEKKEELERAIQDFANKSLQVTQEYLNKVSRDRFINPVIGAVQVLPKDELAIMAETLVSLTSFRRKMSLEVESVGGPIDVAVISKKDGFIWIKRKHYFNPELNRDFFARRSER